MPYVAGGNLRSAIDLNWSKGIKDEVLIASILKQLISGLAYIHQMGYVHRDINASNILISDQGRVYISHFSITKHLRTCSKEIEFAGSPCWMAPEVMKQESGYVTSADIWSLGITIIEMTEGKAPNEQYSGVKVL